MGRVTDQELLDIKKKLLESCTDANCRDGYLVDKDEECRHCLMEFRARHRMLRGGFSSHLVQFQPEEIFNRLSFTDESRAVLQWWLGNLDTVDSQGLSLYIFSEDTGVGKTSLATMLVKAHALHFLKARRWKLDYKVKFMDSSEFFDRGSARYAYNRSSWEAFVSEWETTHLWVFDEFGREQFKTDTERLQHHENQMENFIRCRIKAQLPTIYTANLPPYDIENKLSPFFSSLLEAPIGGLHFRYVQVLGLDRRMDRTSSAWGV